MFLGKAHAASDLYSPLFGPTMGFKTNSYNTKDPPTDIDARRFGEKPFLIYTSWLLNRRFGGRKRKGQVHFVSLHMRHILVAMSHLRRKVKGDVLTILTFRATPCRVEFPKKQSSPFHGQLCKAIASAFEEKLDFNSIVSTLHQQLTSHLGTQSRFWVGIA